MTSQKQILEYKQLTEREYTLYYLCRHAAVTCRMLPTLKYITQGITVRQRCQRNTARGGKTFFGVAGLTKDKAGLQPDSNTILKTHTHIRTHHHGTAIDPGGQERGFSHQRDSFLLQQQRDNINPQVRLMGTQVKSLETDQQICEQHRRSFFKNTAFIMTHSHAVY